SSFPRVVASGPLGAGAAHLSRGSAKARRHRSFRSIHRWLLCECKKRGACVGKTKRGKGTKIMAIADRSGLPLALSIASASPHETTLVEKTLEGSFVTAKLQRLIGDKGYDS